MKKNSECSFKDFFLVLSDFLSEQNISFSNSLSIAQIQILQRFPFKVFYLPDNCGGSAVHRSNHLIDLFRSQM